MSLWSVLGGALGAVAGFAIGGPVGAGIGLGLGSSVGGSVDKSNAQKDANETNLAIAQGNNDTSLQVARENISAQEAENQKSRQFSMEQQQREFDQQKAMWELQTNYNSPVEQVKRLREAGLNPALAMNGNGAMVSSQSMPSVPSAPSPSLGISPSMPVLQNGHVEPIPSIGLTQIDAIGRLLEAKKASADADLSVSQKNQIDGMFNESLRALQLDNDAKDMANTLQRDMMPLIRTEQGKRYMAEVAVLTKQAFMYEEQGNKAKSDAALNEIIGKLREAETQVAKENRQLFHMQVEGYPDQLKATLRKLNSEANLNNANAQLSQEEAKRIRELLPDEKRLKKLEADYKDVEISLAKESAKEIAARVVGIVIENGKKALSFEYYDNLLNFTQAQIEADLRTTRDYNSMPQWLRWFGNILGHAASGSGAQIAKSLLQ